MSKAIIYGDISPNVTDGSSIWLISITETLAGVFEEVHLLLKMNPQHDRLIGRLKDIGNIVIHPPRLLNGEKELTADRAAEEVSQLVSEIQPTAVIARGMDLCNTLCMQGNVAALLWSYITDLPFPLDKLSVNGRNRLRRIAMKSRRVFVQTEGARSYLESVTPEAAGKAVLMRPMIPDEVFADLSQHTARNEGVPLKIVYAGKLASAWKTLEMLEIPRALRERGIDAELRVVGDKFNRDRKDPHWVGRMQAALRGAHEDPESGVTWVGGLPRHESLQEIANADIGIGWRTAELDSSLEISTKALEYSASGTMSLVNRTNDNVELFGADYPFFVSSNDDVHNAAAVIEAGLAQLNAWVKPVQKSAQAYSFDSARNRLRRYFSRAGALHSLGGPAGSPAKPVKVVIAAHDFKFLGELLDQLERDPAYEIRFDRWESLHQHDVKQSLELAEWADTVFCEWAGPNLKWYSQNLREGTTLVSRLHGFELRGQWLKEVNFDNVEAMVFVSDFYRDKAIKQLDLEPDRTYAVANMVDLDDFDRPKLPGAQFNIGMVGMVPFLKRPDRALNFLELLLEVDDQYTLFIKGRAPWEYPYEWNNPIQKQAYLEFFNRLAQNQELAQHVVFDPFGPEVASWFRNIGVILSPSDQESFHLAPAEGMASRAVPVVWEREGSRSVFGDENVYLDVKQALDKILAMNSLTVFREAGESAREYARRFDIDSAMFVWKSLLKEGRAERVLQTGTQATV